MRARAILAAFLALSCVSLLPAAGKLELFVGNSPELAMPFGIDFLADGTLVTHEEWRRQFPAIPGAAVPRGRAQNRMVE